MHVPSREIPHLVLRKTDEDISVPDLASEEQIPVDRWEGEVEFYLPDSMLFSMLGLDDVMDRIWDEVIRSTIGAFCLKREDEGKSWLPLDWKEDIRCRVKIRVTFALPHDPTSHEVLVPLPFPQE